MKKILRYTILLSLLVIAVAIFVYNAYRQKDESYAAQRSEIHMGVICDITLISTSEFKAKELIRQSFEKIAELDKKLSRFYEDSEVNRINQFGFGNLIPVSQDIYDVLKASQRHYERTKGAFDITVYPLMKAWGFYSDNVETPSNNALKQALEKVGSEYLLLDDNPRRVGFQLRGMGVDIGGVAKGYVCDKIVQYLKDADVRNAMVNIGGVIFAYGKSPSLSRWHVGIPNPVAGDDYIQVITLDNSALSTSGNFKQIEDGHGKKEQYHIIDPRTGKPSTKAISVSVLARNAFTADALSTALFVLGPDEVDDILEYYPNLRYFIVSPDGTLQSRV